MISDQCYTCRHYSGSQSCRAFPGGIPEEIMSGRHDHRTPYDGDHDILWEQDDGPESVTVDTDEDPNEA